MPPLVVVAGVLLGCIAVGLASTRLGVSTDTDALFSDSLPWKQRKEALDRSDFPQFQDLIVAVIDAQIPEEADATAAGLAAAMAADTAHTSERVTPAGCLALFREERAHVSCPVAELGPLMDRTIDAQPFLGQLVADPSARGLFAALSLIGPGAGARSG